MTFTVIAITGDLTADTGCRNGYFRFRLCPQSEMATSSSSNEPYLLKLAETSPNSRFATSKRSPKVFLGTSLHSSSTSDAETLNGGKHEVEFYEGPTGSYTNESLRLLFTGDISHKCACSSCGDDIRGTKWSCKDCIGQFHLCTRCYNADKHYDEKHQFERIDIPDQEGVLVDTRDRAEKLEVHGYEDDEDNYIRRNVSELETGMVYLYHLATLEKYKDNFCRPGPTASGAENAAKGKKEEVKKDMPFVVEAIRKFMREQSQNIKDGSFTSEVTVTESHTIKTYDLEGKNQVEQQVSESRMTLSYNHGAGERNNTTMSGEKSAEGKSVSPHVPVEFFGVLLSELRRLPVRDVLSHCQQFLSDFGMSELGDRWTSQNTDPVVGEFFSRLAQKGKQAQEIFFCSLITALEKVDESVTRNIRAALFIAICIVMMPCPEEVVDIVSQQISRSWKKMARKLGIKDEKIDAIQVEETVADERTRLVLRRWRESKGKDATTRDIMFVLTAVGCAQVNLIIMEELNLIPNRQSSNIR